MTLQEFDNNYKRSKDKFTAYVYSLVRNFINTEDILQESYLRMIEKIDQYDPSRPFEAWAMGFVRMQVLRHKQERARSRIIHEEFSDEIVNALSEEALGNEVFRLKREDMYSMLEEGLKKLTPFLNQLIQMKYQRGLTDNEIAAELGKNVGSIEMGLTRARRILKDFVSKLTSTEDGDGDGTVVGMGGKI